MSLRIIGVTILVLSLGIIPHISIPNSEAMSSDPYLPSRDRAVVESKNSCFLKVEIVDGFSVGRIKVVITSENCSDLKVLEWTISVKGLLVVKGKTTTGSIPGLPPGEQRTIESNPVVGFGPAKIAVTVSGCNPVVANAILVGPLLIIL